MRRTFWPMLAILFLFLPAAFAAEAPDAAAPATETLAESPTLLLRVPILSPLFADTPAALVGGRPVLLGELSRGLKASGGEAGGAEATRALAKELRSRLEHLRLQESAAGKEKGGAARNEVYVSPDVSPDLHVDLRVPLFARSFEGTPVAVVGGEPVTVGELMENLGQMHEQVKGGEAASSRDYAEVLKRLITVRLVLEEARAMDLGEIPDVKKGVEDFTEKTLLGTLVQQQLRGVKADPEKVDELYRQISQEAKLRSYTFEKEEEAQSLLKDCEAAGDCRAKADAAVKDGRAGGGKDGDYVKLKDLRPVIAQEAFSLEVGSFSRVFRESPTSFIIFQLEGRRFVEDEAAREEAERMVLDEARQKATQDYITALQAKYVTFDDKASALLDFEAAAKAARDEKLSVRLDRLCGDETVLATISGEKEGRSGTVTVAEVATAVKAAFFHGLDQEGVDPKKVDEKKDKVLRELLFKKTGRLEAEAQGIDRLPEFEKKVREFRNNIVFGAFIQKVVAPDVALSEKDLRAYYDEHVADYSTPKLVQLKSLVFRTEQGARDALEKLKKGSDFGWVSANARGLVPGDAEGVLPLDKNLLAVSALPEGLQAFGTSAQVGESTLYGDPGKFFYVLYVQSEYPPKPKPYEQVRKEIGSKLYNQKMVEALNAYVEKLRKAYGVETFLKT